jgi:hypothetical protein
VLGTEFADERGHPHAFDDQAGSHPLHGREKIASSVINSCKLSQIDFDPSVRAQRATPGVLCFGDPRALKPARKFQPANRAIFANPDAQHNVANVYRTGRAKSADPLNNSRDKDLSAIATKPGCPSALARYQESGQMPGNDGPPGAAESP